jgi:hypothetical protein
MKLYNSPRLNWLFGILLVMQLIQKYKTFWLHAVRK